MRLLLLALLLLPLAAAEDHYTLRGSVGDIVTTTGVEPAGLWNLDQEYTVEHNGTSMLVADLPAGAVLMSVDCTCTGLQTEQAEGQVTVTLPDTIAAGTYTVNVASSQAVGTAFGFSMVIPEGRVILFTPSGTDVDSNIPFSHVGKATGGEQELFESRGSTTGNAWFAIAPAGQVVASEDGFDYMALAIGLVGGALVWAFLVKQGLAQKRSRKQVVTKAAHSEVKARESAETLTVRKRLLMASLKELEVAKMNKEVDDATYEALKADYKRQTVTVMRAMEE